MCRPPIQLPKIKSSVGQGGLEASSVLADGYSASLPQLALKFLRNFSLVMDSRGIYTGTSGLTIYQTHNSELHCSRCKALLGHVATGGWRIYKSSLSVKARSDKGWETFPPEVFISSQLLGLIDSSAARKFVVHSKDTKHGLLVS